MDGKVYVAVSDSDRAYAGHDGGAQTGGQGRWRVGQVGPWTAKLAVPLARRDPDSGLIRSGYLEEVLESRTKDDGTVVATRTQQLFETREEQQARIAAAREGQSVAGSRATASPRASARALNGGASVDAVLSGGKSKKGKPASADKVLQGRVSDQPVG